MALWCPHALPSMVAGLTARTAHLQAPFQTSPSCVWLPPTSCMPHQAAACHDWRTTARSRWRRMMVVTFRHSQRLGMRPAHLDQDAGAELSPAQDRTRASLEGIGAALLPEVDSHASGGLDTLTRMNARLVDWPQSDQRSGSLVEVARDAGTGLSHIEQDTGKTEYTASLRRQPTSLPPCRGHSPRTSSPLGHRPRSMADTATPDCPIGGRLDSPW